jgi:hypothetical protein
MLGPGVRERLGEMRMRGILIVLVATTVGIWPAEVRAQRQMQFFAGFVDPFGDAITDVLTEEVHVLEDGVEGRVVRMEPVDWPIKVTILVDNGVGMVDHLLQIRNGVRGLVEALPEGVEVSMLTTAPQPRWLVRPTVDRDALLEGLHRITPDRSSPRLVEALDEATERIAKEVGNFFPVVIVLGSTTAEDGFVPRQRIERMLRRLYERAATVHVVMLTTSGRAAGQVSGAFQTGVGSAVTQLTGGRYEALAAASRIATLLPEIGEQVSVSHTRQSQQYRVIFERPNGLSGPLGSITVAVENELRVHVSLDGHLP